MKKIIHRLRNQPEEVRTHMLNVLTAGSAVVLGLLWVYSLGTNLANPDTSSNIKKDLQPFSVLKDNLVGGYQSFSQPDQATPPTQDDQQIDMSALN